MSLGPIGNTSAVPQVATDSGEKKVAANGSSHIKTIYGDDSKKNTLSAHVNRMSGFYASVKSTIDSINASIYESRLP